MHGHGTSLSIAVDQRIFGPTPLVRTHAAPSKHLLHAVVQAIRETRLAARAMLAGENLAFRYVCLVYPSLRAFLIVFRKDAQLVTIYTLRYTRELGFFFFFFMNLT